MSRAFDKSDEHLLAGHAGPRLNPEEIEAAMRQAIAPYEDATSAFLASGLSTREPPPDDGWGKGPERILLAARDEFFRLGYHGTSTRQIATTAGMSPTAMYAHYPSKESMLFNLCVLGHGCALEVLREAADPELLPTRRLRRAVYAFAYWHAENHVLTRVVQWNIAALAPGNFQLIASLRQQTDQLMRSILIEGAQSGDFLVPDIATTTLAILSLCIDLGRWYPSRTINVPHSLASTYVSLVETMLVSKDR